MQLIKKCAEADLFETNFLDQKTLLKKRIAKSYRNEQLDNDLRLSRTRQESRMLSKAKRAGVLTPLIYFIDEKNYAIYMEFIEGRPVKNTIELDIALAKNIGREIAKLHQANIIHGDLTTSNIMLDSNKLIFIDFGLSFQSRDTEDKAVDLLVFKRTLEATHNKIFEETWKLIVDGYLEIGEKKVFDRLRDVEKRARYH